MEPLNSSTRFESQHQLVQYKFNLAVREGVPKVRIVIFAPRSNLAKLETIEVVGSDVAISRWEEERSGENRTALTVFFDTINEESSLSKICLKVKFEDGRICEVFGNTGLGTK